MGTWGGRDAGVPTASPVQLSSDDGALVMLLKQSNHLFVNRLSLVQNGQNGVCDLPALYSSTTRNAYFFPIHGCSVLLPGILVPPFASNLYDDNSLRARIGWIVAHEFAHATAAVRWNRAAMDALLVGYRESTQAEAVADVAAAAAIIARYPEIGREAFCQHLSQLWCARQPMFSNWVGFGTAAPSHPLPNERGDLLCAFLRRTFAR